MFDNFETCKNWIENIKRFGSKLDLSRITEVLDKLGNPQNKYPTIHVGGTNGKGSTASYIKSILVEAGFSVGLYTSPYVVKFNERIAINNEYIPDHDVLKYVNILYPIWLEYNDSQNTITFFEMLTIIRFLYFMDQGVDFAVIEVGLGGTLDATNVIIPEVAVITNISFDHMNVLGNTLESIALNKLGIVKQNIPLVTTVDNPELLKLFREVCEKKNADLTIVNPDDIRDLTLNRYTVFKYQDEEYQLGLVGIHQAKNAALAIETIRKLCLKRELNINLETIKVGLLKTKWPGRFELVRDNIVLDGAHNIGGILALRETVNAMYKSKRIISLVSIMDDKDHEKMIEVIDSFSDEVYFTQFAYSRRAEADALYQESHSLHKHLSLDYQTELAKLTSRLNDNEVLIITGSLYFISEVRKYFIK